MANMSYCRFENTARDLNDCEEALMETLDGQDKLSSDELRAAKRMMDTMARMLLLVKEQTGMDDEDFVDNLESENMGDTLDELMNDIYGK